MTFSPPSRRGPHPGRALAGALRPIVAAIWGFGAGAGLSLLAPAPIEAQTLRGSQASLDRQNAQAQEHDFTYLRTASQVGSFVNSGYLVPVTPGSFELKDVSFPFARTEVRLFVERLAGQYKAACGETLVVTSLTRPMSQQPRNASDRSVHPTGMAVDLRRSTDRRCRSWLESTLLSLEEQGILEATYERNPPHYHVAVFPQPYGRYVETRTGGAVSVASAPSPPQSAPPTTSASSAPTPAGAASTTAAAPSDPSPSGAAPALSFASHRVKWGETLSEIAVAYGTTLSRLRSENGVSGDFVREGQVLRIPVAGSSSGRGPVVAVASVSPVGASSPAAAPSASAEPARHRVRSGESLWEIARMYGVTEELLRAANGVTGSRILVGQTLLVPVEAPGSGVLKYRVQNGDSLSVIALRLGSTVERIQETNGLENTRIYVGQLLDVPLAR